MKIVLDDGSNYIKLAYREETGDVKSYVLPSRVMRKALPSATASGFSDSSYEVGSERFSVSKNAVDTIPTDNRGYQLSKHNRVLIHHAMKKAGITSPNVEIMVTLPVGQFFNPDGSRNEKLIAEKINNAKGELKHLDGSGSLNIEACYVMPEAVPAFVHAKKELNLTGSRYLLADIGGTTTDLVVINDENQIEQFESLNLGALKMLSRFSMMVCESLQLSSLSDELAVKGLLEGTVAGEDVTAIATRVLHEFEAHVNESIERLGELRIFDGVIYSGGGANLLSSKYIDVLKTKEPQLDNAKGALDILEA